MGIRHLLKFGTVALVIVSVGLVLFSAPGGIRLAGAALLFGFLPGWALVYALPWCFEDIFERLTLAIGLSCAGTILISLVLVYVQGRLTATILALTLGFVSMVFWAARLRRTSLSHQSPRLHVYD
ncbi:MAG: DUF1616 domain-containing protein [Anaerolineae bacterium]|nr:DUF1616 domain-containing protein [Anaerolineae bacterium]MDW8071274.1 hypothetical protein [Anaerolineae bacterium]